MATVSQWTPFGVALDITATAGTVTRISATQFTVKINASWETYWSGAESNYEMKASSGGNSITLNAYNNYSSGSSGSFTGTYSVSTAAATTQTITVTFANRGASGTATKNISLSVSVPAMTYTVTFVNGLGTTLKTQTVSYGGSATPPSNPTRTGYTFNGWSGTYTSVTSNRTITATWKANTYAVTYNANGGSGAPSADTKTYGTTLTLSNTIPTREGYNFLGWATSSTGSVAYLAGASYTANAPLNLYAVWELANGKSSISLSLSAVKLGGDLTVNISSMDASNTHTVVWTYGDESFTSHTECTESFTMKMDNATFVEWLGENKAIDITVTVTTYSGSTNLGSISASFRYYIPERRYKRGFYVFTNGEWKYCKAYVYLEEKDLVSKDEYEIVDADGLELKGDDSWENIR